MNLVVGAIICAFISLNIQVSVVYGDMVTLPQGKVRGTNNFIDGYNSYLGIPYASVKERYQEAGDPPSWKGIFKADRETKCKQFSAILRQIVGIENCLTVNVYTPFKRRSKLLPVIVFMHGGGFFWGSNTNMLYNPKYLIEKNVVVVNINYRLGAFGFLCLKTKGAPGNVGMKDQVAALRWVKNNIAYFGGNPDSVTLFGESAGASSAIILILSQAAKGLFHNAIVHSGTVNTPHVFDRNPIQSAALVANRLGYKTMDTDELLKIFRNSTADNIVSASYVDSTNNVFAPYILNLCKEDPNVSKSPIIVENPTKMLESVNEISNINIIMGYNDQEGIMWASKYDSRGLKALDKNFTNVIPRTFTFDSAQDKASFIERIRAFYFNNLSTNYKGLINYFSDSLIIYPSVLTMEAFMKNPKIKMFNYYFEYYSTRNLNKLMSSLRWTPGANHADELFYLFYPIVFQLLPSLPSNVDFIDTMTTLWTNFAKTGVPSTKSISWKPSESELKFLKLGRNIEMIGLPNRDRISFWRAIDEKCGLNYA